MFLIADIGNTYTKVSIYNPKINKIYNFNTFQTNLIKKNKKFLNLVNKLTVKYFVATSVVPNVFNDIKKILKKKQVKCFEILDKKLCNPIKINVKKPKQVGSDRIANAIGAYNFYKRNCVIVDFGTATTFDILDGNVYQGGLITPGVKLSLMTLNSLTALLPLIKLKKTSNIIGKDTFSAINSGVYWGYVSLINGILEKIILSTKKKYKIILTGGLSSIFVNSLKYKSVFDKNITLWGVVELIKYNKKVFNL